MEGEGREAEGRVEGGEERRLGVLVRKTGKINRGVSLAKIPDTM
jgi:hypothetical protein